MFITFEGVEGSGKSTVIDKLANYMTGRNVCVTREPGGSRHGKLIRQLLLSSDTGEMEAEAELYLFMADRVQHIAEVIRPALARGDIVICDRYIDSTIAYQGYGRGLPMPLVEDAAYLHGRAIEPDITILLSIPPVEGLLRVRERNRLKGLEVGEDRFDSATLDFHSRVSNGYLSLAQKHPERIKIVDAQRGQDEVFEECKKILSL